MAGPFLHVVGARPNFVKAAPVVAALERRGAEQRVVHTGQHYDERMSGVFFRDLGLPRPDTDLGVGSGSQAEQTAALLTGLEDELVRQRPGTVVVYGDVNSTVAAALAAAKLSVPVAHVEAGLRSFDRTMPEEVNRRVTDALSDVCFATSPEAVGHLAAEGVPVDRVHLVGNPMIDTLLTHLDRFDTDGLRARIGLPERYVAATLHRPANVDRPDAVARLVAAVHEVADAVDVVMPVHPRGRDAFAAAGLDSHPRVHLLEPLGYIDFVALVRGAAAVVTDSGGVQEETTILGVPCLTLRPNTERPVTVSHGTNRLVPPDELGDLPRLAAKALEDGAGTGAVPPLWDGRAGERIAAVLTGTPVPAAPAQSVPAAEAGAHAAPRDIPRTDAAR
ncbi:UDP-N-acetylglucosamine 2-epimerase (non-hydrolyzing) [Nocardiopsis coralliicola]